MQSREGADSGGWAEDQFSLTGLPLPDKMKHATRRIDSIRECAIEGIQLIAQSTESVQGANDRPSQIPLNLLFGVIVPIDISAIAGSR